MVQVYYGDDVAERLLARGPRENQLLIFARDGILALAIKIVGFRVLNLGFRV